MHVGRADHRLLVAGLSMDATVEDGPPQELAGGGDAGLPEEVELEYDLDPLEKDGHNRKRFHEAARAASQQAVERLQRRVDRTAGR